LSVLAWKSPGGMMTDLASRAQEGTFHRGYVG
jgi:hypothetical protein